MVANLPSLTAYPWYLRVEDSSLEQGDFLFACPVMTPVLSNQLADPERQSLQAVIDEYDVIVLSQSCDLTNGKLESVLVCPFWSIEVAEHRFSQFRSSKEKEAIRRGNVPGMHMLSACEIAGFMAPVRIVSFRSVFSLPFDYVQSLAAETRPRLRLLPPYREHLAQAFARFIMRVGLPVDIPPYR